MKHIKTFEKIINTDIKIGDYVLINCVGYSGMGAKKMMNFINNNIGRIINIDDPEKRWDNLSVAYENVPDDIIHPWFFIKNDIIFKRIRYGYIIDKSKNKVDLEYILQAKKFNL